MRFEDWPNFLFPILTAFLVAFDIPERIFGWIKRHSCIKCSPNNEKGKTRNQKAKDSEKTKKSEWGSV